MKGKSENIFDSLLNDKAEYNWEASSTPKSYASQMSNVKNEIK